MEQNGDWSKYSAAKTVIDEIAAKYGINGYFVGEEELKKDIELMEEYGFYKVKNFVGGNFELRFVPSRYRLTNTVFTDKSIPEPKWFMLLENGNVGAYSICKADEYDRVTNGIYARLCEKLNALSYKYDPLNSYWLFVPSQDTAEQVEKLVRGAIDEVESERSARRRERLLAELAELDAAENGGAAK